MPFRRFRRCILFTAAGIFLAAAAVFLYLIAGQESSAESISGTDISPEIPVLIGTIEMQKGTGKQAADSTDIIENTQNSLSVKETLTAAEAEEARLCWYSNIMIPPGIEANDYIDIRLSVTDGRDYVVLSKKRVAEYSAGGTNQGIWLTITEEELLHMSSAVSDLRCIPGSALYAVKYISENQIKSVPTYPVNPETRSLIEKDPNIQGRVAVKTDKELDQLREKSSPFNADSYESTDSIQYWEN